MSSLILPPGMGNEPPAPIFTMPMMRGFPCDVMAIMGEPGSAPQQGMGIGWQMRPGAGAVFFVSIHGADDDVLIAQLDVARYQRLCELLASAGKQALLNPGVEEVAPDDPLAALSTAYEALGDARIKFGFYEEQHRAKGTPEADEKAEVNRDMASRMADAMRVVAKALRMAEGEADVA